MSRLRACPDCLRRSWLVARLAGHIERTRRDRARLAALLALSDEALLEAVAGGRRAQVAAERRCFDPAAARAACRRAGTEAICRHDAAYPARLGDAGDAPAVVHVAGRAELLTALGPPPEAAPAVAVVGARRATEHGRGLARRLGRGLGAAGVTVVSGMALGIDAAAHTGALEAGGPTIAVLAGGADVAYPATERGLHRDLLRRGCVVSEMPPGVRPLRWCFPARNRIIAALAGVTVVVEATERSGSLITADLAAQLGRTVGAVPGRVGDARASGTNALLHDGAHVVRDAQDVLDVALAAGWAPADGAQAARDATAGAGAAGLAPELQRLLGAVRAGHATPAAAGTAAGQRTGAGARLAELEMLGYVRREPDGRYLPVG